MASAAAAATKYTQDDGDMCTDEVGRCFCSIHKRDMCHECGADYREMNEYAEMRAGLRPQISRLDELAYDIAVGEAGVLECKKKIHEPGMAGMLKFNEDMLAKSKAEWAKLAPHSPEEAAEAVEKARRKQYEQEAERQAMIQGLVAANPGKAHIEFGGAQTQEVCMVRKRECSAKCQSKRERRRRNLEEETSQERT